MASLLLDTVAWDLCVDANGNIVATVRALADWERKVDVSMWAVDVSDRTDEAKQIEAIETLFES